MCNFFMFIFEFIVIKNLMLIKKSQMKKTYFFLNGKINYNMCIQPLSTHIPTSFHPLVADTFSANETSTIRLPVHHG